MRNKLMALLPVLFLMSAVPAFSAAKTYTLTDLKQVVASGERCDDCLKTLQTLGKAPFSLEFTKQSEEGEHTVRHVEGLLSNHTHTTVSQKAEGDTIVRIGTGSFTLEGKDFDYVMIASANVGNAKHQYLYPITFAGDKGHCFYTGLLKPSAETVAAFQESVRSGAAAKGADLHHQP